MTKSKSFYKFNSFLFMALLIFGVLLYDIIADNLGFTYTDEAFALIMFLYFIVRRQNKGYIKEFYFAILVFAFYFFYSYVRRITEVNAIIYDFFVQIKPYMVFYCALITGFTLSEKSRRSISRWCIVFAIILLPIGTLYITSEDYIGQIIHPSRFATMCTVLGMSYLYCSKRRKNDILIALLIIAIGLMSLRSKMYGFFAVACLFFLFIGNKKIKVSPKYVILGTIIIGISIYVAREKIEFYFIEGSQAQTSFARYALYSGVPDILRDYFPFGSGFGTYATDASSKWFSPLYVQYTLLMNSEIGDGKFISDTFYPCLAQFGVVGIILFLWFWIRRIKTINRMADAKLWMDYKCCLLIVIFFVIECIADSTYIQNRGLAMFLLLAMFMNDKNNSFSTSRV